MKKKIINSFIFLLLVFCMLFLGGFLNVSRAFDEDTPNTSLNNNWLSQDSMLKILTGLKIDKYNGNINFLQNYCNVNSLDYNTQSGEVARSFSTSFNRWFNNASYNYDVNLNNLVFMWGIPTFNSSSFSANTYLTINIYSQGSIYVSDVIPYLSQFETDSQWGNGRWVKWNSWNYDTNNNISGVNSSTTTNTTSNIWKLTTTNCTQESSLQTNSTYTPYSSFGYRENFSERIYTTIWAPLSVSGDYNYYHDVAYYKNSNPKFYGADSLYYHIDIVTDDSIPIPTPTPIPTGSGGDSQDFIDAQTDYWGDRNSLSGDNFTNSISGFINNGIDTFSGDLAQNSVFSTIQDFENGFFNLLSNRDLSSMDFRIFWPDIKWSWGVDTPMTIIHSGEVNFSKICRDNSTLGNVQDTVRVIFNFFFGYNLLIYAYNLILICLGVGDSYLLDNPDNPVEDIVIDANTGLEMSYLSLRGGYGSPHRSLTVVRRKGGKR